MVTHDIMGIMLCNGSGALGVREKNLHVQQSNEGVVHQSLGKGAITTLWNGALVLMAHGNESVLISEK